MLSIRKDLVEVRKTDGTSQFLVSLGMLSRKKEKEWKGEVTSLSNSVMLIMIASKYLTAK